MLKELAPKSSRVLMFNPATSPYNDLLQRSVEDAAGTFHVEVARAPVWDDGDIASAFERFASSPDVGLLVPSDAFTYFRSGAIVTLAAKCRCSRRMSAVRGSSEVSGAPLGRRH